MLRTVGAGGEGHVVQALDRQHDRFVALKVRAVPPGTPIEQVLQEPRVLLGLTPHPSLPLVREDFFEGDVHYTVLDWIDGTDLGTLLQTKGTPGLTPSSVLAYLADTAAALTFLHQHDPPVIHGDIKPANLILSRGGRITLVDFGLSSSPATAAKPSGTPGYQAPELTAGGRPSRASDVYAFAATAFALLTGSPPDGDLPRWESLDETRARRLEAGLRAGLATDPAQRPATPGELVELLRGGWASALPTGVVSLVAAEIDPESLPWDSDPSRAAATLVRCDEIVAGVVESRDGRFLKPIGEATSTISAFHSAEQAVAAAIEASRALADAVDDGAALARFAVHTGEAQVRGTGYLGTAATVATRMRAEAEPGEVFVSDTTGRLAGAGLLDGYSIVDVGPLDLGSGGRPGRLQAIAGPGLTTPNTTECPYRGLLAFGPDDHALYFGREELLRDALARIAPGRLLAVVGASGSGKTSLLGAGITAAVRDGGVPRIRRSRVITPGPNPAPRDAEGSADELLIVDQFEELFTQCRDPALRAAFVEGLLNRPGPTAIGLRADFYGETAVFGEFSSQLAGNQVLLGPMNGEDLYRAISEPARRAGLRLEPGLVNHVLRDVADEPGALPLMSHALRETWERREGRTLTISAYEESGGVDSAVARTADAVLAATPEADRPLLRGMFVRMTELGDDTEDTRRRVPIDELVGRDDSGPAARSLLERLSRVRLVTLDAGTAEVAHEALIRHWPALRAWLDEDRESIRLHRRLADAARLWETGGRLGADLYRGARLDAVLEWVRSHGSQMNAGERAFLTASVEESRHQQRRERISNRRLRQSLGVAGGLLIAGAALLVFALISRHHAVGAERSARMQGAAFRSQELAAAAEAQVARDPQLALLVARAAMKAAPTPAAMLATSEALDANTLRGEIPSFGAQGCVIANYLNLLDRGRTAVDNTCDGTVVFADLAGRRIVKRVNVGASTSEMFPTDGGRALIMASGTRVLRLDVATGRVRTLFASPLGIQEVVLSPNGRTFAITDGVTVTLVDSRTHRMRVVARGDPSANQLANLLWASDRLLLIETTGQTRGAGTLPPGVSTLDVTTGARTAVRLPVLAGYRTSLAYSTLSPDRRTWYFNGSEVNPTASTHRGATWAIDAATRKPRWTVLGAEGATAVPGTVSSPDGKLVAIGYSQGEINVLDARTGDVVARHHTSSSINAGWMAFPPGHGSLVTVTLDGVIRTWSNRPSERLRFQGPPAPALGFTPAGELTLIGNRGEVVDSRTGAVRRTFPGFPGGRLFNTCSAACVSLSSGGRWLTYVDPSSAVPRVVEISATTGARVASASISYLNAQGVTADGRIVSDYVSGTSLHATLIDPRSGRRRALQTSRASLGCTATIPAFTPDGRLLAIVDGCDTLTVWNLRSGRVVRTIALPDRSNGAGATNGGTSASPPALTADGRYVLVTVEGGGLVRANIGTGAVDERPGTGLDAQALALTPDGRFYAVGRQDGTIDEYDARTLQIVRHVVLSDPIRALAYSPDSQELAVKDARNVVHVFDTCAVCEDADRLSRLAARQSVRSLTPSERAIFGVSSP